MTGVSALRCRSALTSRAQKRRLRVVVGAQRVWRSRADRMACGTRDEMARRPLRERACVTSGGCSLYPPLDRRRPSFRDLSGV